ncbi:MAG: hypothetical protein JOZ73_13810 [Solirubrobacterales bacterium]|nr:hypothetical protein [Solirubrobacterales bacterium]
MTAPSELVDAELRQLVDPPSFRYYRIEPAPGAASPKLDDASGHNIQSLEKVASDLIAQYDQQLDEICTILRAHPTPQPVRPSPSAN